MNSLKSFVSYSKELNKFIKDKTSVKSLKQNKKIQNSSDICKAKVQKEEFNFSDDEAKVHQFKCLPDKNVLSLYNLSLLSENLFFNDVFSNQSTQIYKNIKKSFFATANNDFDYENGDTIRRELLASLCVSKGNDHSVFKMNTESNPFFTNRNDHLFSEYINEDKIDIQKFEEENLEFNPDYLNLNEDLNDIQDQTENENINICKCPFEKNKNISLRTFRRDDIIEVDMPDKSVYLDLYSDSECILLRNLKDLASADELVNFKKSLNERLHCTKREFFIDDFAECNFIHKYSFENIFNSNSNFFNSSKLFQNLANSESNLEQQTPNLDREENHDEILNDEHINFPESESKKDFIKNEKSICNELQFAISEEIGKKTSYCSCSFRYICNKIKNNSGELLNICNSEKQKDSFIFYNLLASCQKNDINLKQTECFGELYTIK